MSSNVFITFIVVFTLSACHGARILFLLPLASKSHVNVFEPLIKALGERGHEVVNLSPIKSPNMPPTVKQVQLITVGDLFGKMALNPFEIKKASVFQTAFNSSNHGHIHDACVKALKNPELHSLLRSDESFDLVVVDILLNFCLLGVVPHFKAPSIMVTTMSAPSIITSAVGNRLPPSFVPSIIMKHSDTMSFPQRIANTVADYVLHVMWEWFLVRSMEKLYHEHLPRGELLPSVQEIMGNTSMIFSNSHFTLNYPKPLLPDVIEVGGMHTRPPQPLPKELDTFLAGAGPHGFIFFSLGTIVKGKDMPEGSRKVLVNVFSRLKQRVLWKWDGESMPDLPPNVKLSKWLPQQDILGHPNIRLFMTHGGILSTQESVFHGVPLLGLPILADQYTNIEKCEMVGYAKSVDILAMSEETLEAAIMEMLNNPVYREKAMHLSKLVRDLPETPLEKAVFWTEYVIRHKGAPHLRSAARDLNFFQYYVLDVAAALLIVLGLALYLLIRCCKCTCRRIRGRGSNPPDKSKKD